MKRWSRSLKICGKDVLLRAVPRGPGLWRLGLEVYWNDKAYSSTPFYALAVYLIWYKLQVLLEGQPASRPGMNESP